MRQYGLLVGFDQNTQPLSQAGAIQLATTVVGRHMDILFEQDLGAFKTVVNGVLGLSHAIGNAMIGGSTTTMDEAIGRVRAWDQAFLAQLDIAIGDTPVPDEEPKAKAPTKNKKDTEETFAAKQEEYRAQLRDICVYKCAQLRDVTRRRETLLTLVEEYEREKRVQNMAEFSDFTIAAYQLVARFPSIGERYRRRYTHVLLDEYQDTSTTQAMLLATLFHPQSLMPMLIGLPPLAGGGAQRRRVVQGWRRAVAIRGERGGRPVPVDLCVAWCQSRSVPHVPKGLRHARRRETIPAQRHATQHLHRAQSRQQPHRAAAHTATAGRQLPDARSGRREPAAMDNAAEVRSACWDLPPSARKPMPWHASPNRPSHGTGRTPPRPPPIPRMWRCCSEARRTWRNSPKNSNGRA